MSKPRFFAAATVLLAAATASGCATIASARNPSLVDAPPAPGWLAGIRRQSQQALAEMKSDLSVMDSNNDGLDMFGPVAAREMRSARADMKR